MKTRHFCCTFKGCHRSFRSEDSLSAHLLHHSGYSNEGQSLKCQKCEREFSTKQSLKEHSYTHLEKKLFRCPEPGCGKTFSQSTQLCNHRKVHKGIRAMVAKQSVDTDQTKEYLQSLSNKILETRFPEGTGNNLPLIKGPETGVTLPRLDFF
jgi:uncharacterized Zn-finger protein